MSETSPHAIRLICSGGHASPHTIRELALLRRRTGRPDLALAEEMAGNYERAAEHMRFTPGWDAAGSYTTFRPGTGRTSHVKTSVTVVDGKRGGQVVHVPPCPECGKGEGLRLPVGKLEEAARVLRGGIDVSAFYA